MTDYFVLTAGKTDAFEVVPSERLEELKKFSDMIQLLNDEIYAVDKSSVSHDLKHERDLILKATREMVIEDIFKNIQEHELQVIRDMYNYHVAGHGWGALLFAERSGRRYRDMVDEMAEMETKSYVPEQT